MDCIKDDSSKRTSVLIVDDEPHIREYLSMLMQSIGFEEIYKASNGIEAICEFDRHLPHLILLDINMPKMNGIDALKAITEKNKGALVVMLTSVNHEGSIMKCLELGAKNYVLKNAKPEEICFSINETIRNFSSLMSKEEIER